MERDLGQQGRMAAAAAEEEDPTVLECTSSTSPAAVTCTASPSPTAKPSKRRREDEEETRNAAGQQATTAPRSSEDDAAADEAAVYEFYKNRGGVRGLVESGVSFVPPLFLSPVAPVSSSAASFAAPRVDLSLPRAQAVALVGAAARSCGIFQVTSHGVPAGAVDAALAAVSAFNELPFAARSPHYSPGAATGGTTYGTLPIPRPVGVTRATATTPLLCWRDSLIVRFDGGCAAGDDPGGIPAACRAALLEFHRSMAMLGRQLAGLLLEGLGVEAGRLGQIQGCLMQCHYHPPCPEPERVLGSREHTDADLFTVLAQDGVGGLQVQLGDDEGEWMDVAPPVDGALLVNVGDLLKVLSNDEYKSVEHRVVSKSAQEPRVSIALFFNPAKHGDSDLFGPFPELVTADKPAQYRSLTWMELLNNRVEVGHAKPSSLDTFKVTSN